ncbi:PREDICTED: uncharacterized protein LOC102114587 [Pseudopodoces humilis]|uniref:uncharacterized protein LOC102114587 n=1 Tax=Pseudopodoces humilis TaxID=181119 RepID=UPI0006B804E4|nr:PREDICTED: uncharacterized protein LOC102114587 [Pseudopodoces humilis]
MVPHDLEELFACLLSPADYSLWKQRWKKSLEAILPELLRSEESAVDADENPLSIDHLCGIALPRIPALDLQGATWGEKGERESSIKLKAWREPAPREATNGASIAEEGGNINRTWPIHWTRHLITTRDILFRSQHWTVVAVDPLEEKIMDTGRDSKYIGIGDTKHTPPEIEISPITFPGGPENLILLARCTHPPFFLPKGQIIAQFIPVPEQVPVDDHAPGVYWAEVVGEEKPILDCSVKQGAESFQMKGLLDMGADVTIIPERRWPSHWELQPVAGKIQGIGGSSVGERLHVPVGGQNRDPENPSGFLEAATVEHLFQKLDWVTDEAVWIDQWPLRRDKLRALNELVEEQLSKGNIIETTSPWNSLVFVIRKPGKDKWRLLHDLRAINKLIVDMGPLQPGMPTPTMLPRNWKLAVIDTKDCFFQIPLHPDDAPWFAFSVPTLNREAPMKRYHWRVLPQGIKNSPTICQWYVSSLLSPVRAEMREVIIYHYMDDVLVCAPHDDMLTQSLDLVVRVLTSAGFQL